ncbi:MAG: poly-gamma-glutamate biosynthesis protein PgsC [Eubacteriales bacterium]|nr:poly-gamma-glutamate biosynthesis protein PgsC [Eubacteriales bacterium]
MNYIYLSIVLGLTLSLLMDDLFGITPGGMVVPGYLALIFNQWPRLLSIYIISLLTYLIVQKVLPRFFILYGKRKFAACIFVGLLIKVIFQILIPLALPETSLFLQGGTVIIPGLLAATYARQGIRYTLPASFFAAAVIFGINSLIFLLY